LGQKQVIIIAGPNGAGKTTFASEFLLNEADCSVFINADIIAASLNPSAPLQAALPAGRKMIGMMEEHVSRGDDFAFETTLAGSVYAARIRRWQALSYHVVLLFLWLPSADVAVARVAERVQQGGHHVPEELIRRRYIAGIRNFRDLYCDIVDDWIMFDNSGLSPVALEWGERS